MVRKLTSQVKSHRFESFCEVKGKSFNNGNFVLSPIGTWRRQYFIGIAKFLLLTYHHSCHYFGYHILLHHNFVVVGVQIRFMLTIKVFEEIKQNKLLYFFLGYLFIKTLSEAQL